MDWEETTDKYSLWWKDGFHGGSEDPTELVEILVDILESWGEDVSHYWTIRKRADTPWGYDRLFSEEEMVTLVAKERERRERTKANEPGMRFHYAEGFMGIPRDMDSDEFHSFWVTLREQREEQKREHPIQTLALDTYHALRRFCRDRLDPKDIIWRGKCAYQRLTRGWSDSDAWSADEYMLDVLIGMLRHLRTHKPGLPGKRIEEFTDQNWRDLMLDQTYGIHFDEDEWNEFITGIILAFERKKAATHWTVSFRTITTEEFDWVDEEFVKAGTDFFRYFNSWWI